MFLASPTNLNERGLIMSDEARERLRGLPTCTLSDAMRRMQIDPGSMHHSMKPAWDGAELCGPAFTVRTYPGATHGCDLALAQAQAGDVLILAAGGYADVILWGEVFSTCAKQLGLAGTLVDGSVRDVDGIRQLGYPVFSRGISPRGGTFDKEQSETQVIVSCAGVVVRPGDWIRGDETGVVVVPANRIDDVLNRSEAICRKEARMLELARAGTSMAEIRRIIASEGL